jgi:pilus assembly protein CpaC
MKQRCSNLVSYSSPSPSRLILLAASLSLAVDGYGQRAPTPPPVATIATVSSDPTDFTTANRPEKLLHVGVGRSLFFNTKHRLTRVYITNPLVMDSYTSSPNEVICTAKAPGLSSLIVWDEAGGSQTYLISADINVDVLADSLKQNMPTENIHALANEGKIVLTGTVATQALSDAAFKLAGLYSKEVSNALLINSAQIKQVKLKVRIVEVDRSKLDQFAFNFFSTGGNNIASTSTTQFPSSIVASNAGSGSSSGGAAGTAGNKTVAITNALNFLLYSSRFNVGATLQNLETRQVLHILAEPNITTLSGQKASFLAGGEFPFPVVQGGVGGLTSITIQFRPYGVKLDFTPNVNADGTIELKVAPEVSALDYTNAVNISGYTIPALSTRKAETQIVLKSGQSFAISGLLDKRTTDSLGRTPGIASVPILGHLFKSKSINHSTTELIVIVTPSIVDPMTDNSVIEEPDTPIPMLDKDTFDSELPKTATKPN